MTRLNDNPVYVAVDEVDVGKAARLAGDLKTSVGGLKLGLEFFCRNGHAGVEAVQAANPLPLFLDLKFHDIPNTVAGAVRAVARLKPNLMTVHASGGLDMMTAARDAACDEAARLGVNPPLLLGVTVLTSLEENDLLRMGTKGSVQDQVRRLAALAQAAGLDGVVCSPLEARVLRTDLGGSFLLVTPGVRPSWAAKGDQKRFTSPEEAIYEGSSLLVIGRPITEAPDPYAAAMRIQESLTKAAGQPKADAP